MKTGAVIAVGIVVGAGATLALTYRSAPVVAPGAAVAAAPAVRLAILPPAVEPQAPVAPVQSQAPPPPAELPVAPPLPPVVAEEDSATQHSPYSSEDSATPANEPQLSESGERQAYNAFNIARQRNAASDPSAAATRPSEPYGHSD